MGANDAAEMLEVAKAECIRLENELKSAQALIALLLSEHGGSATITDEAMVGASNFLTLHTTRDLRRKTTRLWISSPPMLPPEPAKPSRCAICLGPVVWSLMLDCWRHTDGDRNSHVATPEPEPTPDSRKNQNEGEGAPQAADAQSTPAGEGERCETCTAGIVQRLSGVWVHIYRVTPEHPVVVQL